ncbi:hypothetical protein B0H11DRAFT_2026922 [Mycena galericulata]|nr:hypothetical protein B0H11DRAFT_2026922 [Mycena galericulata]
MSCRYTKNPPSTDLCTSMNPRYRDPEFYAEDGDCVVLVGNTLFKINKAQFFPNYLVLRDLLSRGSSDECPISLEGTPDDFRIVCKIFQAQELLQIFRKGSFPTCTMVHPCGCRTYADRAMEPVFRHIPATEALLLSLISALYNHIAIHDTPHSVVKGQEEQEDDPMTVWDSMRPLTCSCLASQ